MEPKIGVRFVEGSKCEPSTSRSSLRVMNTAGGLMGTGSMLEAHETMRLASMAETTMRSKIATLSAFEAGLFDAHCDGVRQVSPVMCMRVCCTRSYASPHILVHVNLFPRALRC